MGEFSPLIKEEGEKKMGGGDQHGKEERELECVQKKKKKI